MHFISSSSTTRLTQLFCLALHIAITLRGQPLRCAVCVMHNRWTAVRIKTKKKKRGQELEPPVGMRFQQVARESHPPLAGFGLIPQRVSLPLNLFYGGWTSSVLAFFLCFADFPTNSGWTGLHPASWLRGSIFLYPESGASIRQWVTCSVTRRRSTVK